MIDLEANSQITTPLLSQSDHSKDHDILTEPNKSDNCVIYLHSIIPDTSFRSTQFLAWLIAMLSPTITMLLVIKTVNLSLHKIVIFSCDTLRVLPSTPSQILFFLLALMLFICIIHKDVKDAMLEQALLQKAKQDKHIIYPRATEVVQFGLRARQIILPTFFTVTALFLSWNGGEISALDAGTNLVLVGFVAYSNSVIGRLLFKKSQQGGHLHEAVTTMYEKETDIQVSQVRSKIMVGVPIISVVVKVAMALSSPTICEGSRKIFSLLHILNCFPYMMLFMDNMLVAVYSNLNSNTCKLRAFQILPDIVLLLVVEICYIIAINHEIFLISAGGKYKD